MDREVRKQKQQALMVQMVERKIRTRAQQIYEARGRVEGFALEDWVQAEGEILEKSILAPLYYRMKTHNWPTTQVTPDFPASEFRLPKPSVSETC